jgi:effector-binding domain-containing protein
MIEEPLIHVVEEQPTAVIRFTIPREEMKNVMGAAIGELMSTVAAQGVKPVGPIFTHHFRIEPGTFDFEVGVPVAAPIHPAGRVVSSKLPAATVARMVHQGPYDGLESAWVEFDRWLKDNGHDPAPNLWEFYVQGPESGPDSTTWRTELNRPIRVKT